MLVCEVRGAEASAHSQRARCERAMDPEPMPLLLRLVSQCLDYAAHVISRKALRFGGDEQLVGGGCHRHGDVVLVAERSCKTHVLLRVLEGEVRGVLAVDHLGALQLEHGVCHCAEVEHLEQSLRGQSRVLCENDALRERSDHGAHDHVHHELHARSGAGLPEKEGPLAHHVQLLLHHIEGLLVSAAQKYELALFSRDLGSRHGRLQKLTALFGDGRRSLLRGLLRERRAVDNVFPRRHAEQCGAVAGPKVHRLDRFRRGKHRKRHGTGLYHRPRRAHDRHFAVIVVGELL
mmetsp:Transcript_6876/g.20911  ORF Transcript_6876/g.20911 Transcript_6876/m.20911 type:complete len:291 (-) Transcript_6876:549-1421(-)